MNTTGRAGWIRQFLAAHPGLAEIYRRKVTRALAQSCLPPETVKISPTLLAVEGLWAAYRGDVTLAEARATELAALERNRSDEAAFFEFRWSYSSTWPYKLIAPWISALSQGLALALHTSLFEQTGLESHARQSERIAASFGIPREQGGFTRYYGDSVFFDEYPFEIETFVFNGAVIAALALEDFADVFAQERSRGLVRSAMRWFETNIQRYDTQHSDYLCPISGYSLAPQRFELLMRFVGAGVLRVRRIELRHDGGKTEILVGAEDDSDRCADAYLWTNSDYMNWSESGADERGPFRWLGLRRGAYDHAPFSFALADSNDQEPPSILATIDDSNGEAVLIQVYDGEQYHTVGACGGAPLSFEARIPEAAFRRALQLRRTGPSFTPSYFGENATLTGLLGAVQGSPKLSYYAERWRPAAAYVPAELDSSQPVAE